MALDNVHGYSSAGGVTLTGGGATINTLFGSTVAFTKVGRDDQTFISALVSVGHFWATGAGGKVTFGVGMGNGVGFNVDTDVCTYVDSVTVHHDVAMGVQRINSIPKGPYTPCLYYRVNSGTITINTGDTVMLYLAEIPYG
jgi:hypothetical protein